MFVFVDQILRTFFLLPLSLSLSLSSIRSVRQYKKIHRYRRHRLILLCSSTRIHRHIFSYIHTHQVQLNRKKKKENSTTKVIVCILTPSYTQTLIIDSSRVYTSYTRVSVNLIVENHYDISVLS